MSATLDALNALIANEYGRLVYLSPESIQVAFYSLSFLGVRSLWIDPTVPADEISDDEWDTIEAYVAGLMREIMISSVGEVFAYVTTLPPLGSLECDGSTYTRVEYPALYDTLDSIYIVDADNFTVPDLRGRVIIPAGHGSGLSTYAVGDTGGLEDVALSTGEMPAHSHTDIGHTHGESTAIPTAITIGAGVPAPSALPGVGITTTGNANLTTEGGGAAHENRQPYYALKYAVRAL